MFTSCYSWLLITDAEDDMLMEVLRELNMRPDSDVIAALTDTTCWRAHNDNQLAMCENFNLTLTQLFKLRSTSNSTLITERLGVWSSGVRTSAMTSPRDIEQRADLQGHPLVVGVQRDLEETDVDIENDVHLLDVLKYVCASLNASFELVPYAKLGWRNDEGVWLHLLGAVTQEAVDIGLDSVSINSERARDMAFTLPLVQSMRNVYFRRPESGAIRDIFLAPFSSRLLACVITTGAVLDLAVVVVNFVQPTSVEASRREGWGVGEAFVWSVSILTMQGSPWNPSSPSGSVVLIFSLIFALIIYNAYAAFITSVLSVHVTAINNLDDLLYSDLKFGYTTATIPSSEDLFLRNSDVPTLRRLYLRSLVQNNGAPDATAGMMRVADGGYAFFVSARLARNALHSLIAHEKRCEVQELSVESARSVLALPMHLHSPYKRLINLSLLRMKEVGVLDRLREIILPDMPSCVIQSTFNSARLSDVYSAFSMLGVGVVVGVLLGVGEALWRRRTHSMLHAISWIN